VYGNKSVWSLIVLCLVTEVLHIMMVKTLVMFWGCVYMQWPYAQCDFAYFHLSFNCFPYYNACCISTPVVRRRSWPGACRGSSPTTSCASPATWKVSQQQQHDCLEGNTRLGHQLTHTVSCYKVVDWLIMLGHQFINCLSVVDCIVKLLYQVLHK